MILNTLMVLHNNNGFMNMLLIINYVNLHLKYLYAYGQTKYRDVS